MPIAFLPIIIVVLKFEKKNFFFGTNIVTFYICSTYEVY